MIRSLVLLVLGTALGLSGCATSSQSASGENTASSKTRNKNAKARLGYVRSKSNHAEFQKFEYQYSMDMNTAIQIEREDRQFFDLCKLYAGQLVPLENMVDTCSDAIATPGVSAKTKMASYYNRGLIHQKLDRLQDARTDFQAAIGLDANFGDAYLAMAGISMLENNPQQARATIETALSTNIRHPAYAHYLLGHALEAESKFVEARAEYRRALELRPNWREASKRIDRINISWPE